MGEKNLPENIICLLEKACGDSIKHYEVIVHEVDSAGQGYLGEMVS